MPQTLSHLFFNNLVWMGWNIFLAIIPYVLARGLFYKKKNLTPLWFFGFIVFVLFLPNAPYILTDIIHITKYFYEVPTLLGISLFTAQFIVFELAGFWLFVESYRLFEGFAVRTFRFRPSFLRLVTFLTTSIGVYIGRFPQLNSWDVFVVPHAVLFSLTHIARGPAILFISGFTIVLFFLYMLREKTVVAR